jgi:bacillolysin
MPSGFQKVRFHVVDRSEEDLRAAGTRRPAYRGVGRARRLAEEAVHFNTDEAAALYYLTKVLEQDERPAVRGLARTARAPVAPDARVVGKEDSPLTNTRLVRLEQTQSSIPIFGSRIIVELDQNRELVDVEADLAEIEGVSPIAALSPGEALKQIAAWTGVEETSLETVQPPELMFYHDDEQDAWHLVWFFRKVPAAPADFLASAAKRKRRGLGRGLSRKLRHPLLNYLVDAHDGTVLFSYSATALLHAPDIPSKCLGIDERDQLQEFWGRKVPGGFEMCDPRRFIQTYDLAGGDIDTDPIPAEAVRSAGNDWGDSNSAAVSAHVNATRVYNFFNGILMRDGVDDRDGDLVSIVNCTCAAEEEPPTYHNAFWWKNRMWYGREEDPSGGYRSYSRYLDVIAHELTHGVT